MGSFANVSTLRCVSQESSSGSPAPGHLSVKGRGLFSQGALRQMTEASAAAWLTYTSMTLLSSFAPLWAPQSRGLFRIHWHHFASLTKTHCCCTLPESPTSLTLGPSVLIFITVILSFCSVIPLGGVSLTCKPVPLLPVSCSVPPCHRAAGPRGFSSGPVLLFLTELPVYFKSFPVVCTSRRHGTLSCHECYHYAQFEGRALKSFGFSAVWVREFCKMLTQRWVSSDG